MNFKARVVLPPLRVVVANPLCSAAQLTIVKILSGLVFGKDQLIDLALLVYSNERSTAEDFQLELHSCGLSCMNSITVSSDLPMLVNKTSHYHLSPTLRVIDADVFCFITNFRNPNKVDFNEIDYDQFDVLYLIIKIANSLYKPPPIVEDELKEPPNKTLLDDNKPIKPIIMADGLVAMNILNYLTKDLPTDIFFCPTPLPAIAKNVLGDHLKVPSLNDINNILVWAANDEVFHIEVEKPIILSDKNDKNTECDWDMIGEHLLQKLKLDHTQFNETWLKKEFIEKVITSSLKNPYGSIYRAAEFARTLREVWEARSAADGIKAYASIGVISDGSLDTIKGFGYVLPIVFSGDTWRVNKHYEESFHLKQEIKRINETVREFKEKLIPYCKKFLEENVKNQAFIQSDDNSESAYSFGDHSCNPPTLRLNIN